MIVLFVAAEEADDREAKAGKNERLFERIEEFNFRRKGTACEFAKSNLIKFKFNYNWKIK